MNDAGIQAPTVGIARLIGEGSRFTVPDHQRDYSWTEDELEQLFEDVTNAKGASQEEYFIGLLVFLSKGSREFGILDGQQRLATTTIILAAIRSWLTVRGLQDDARQIQSKYIADRDLGSSDFTPRLVLNQDNHPLFERFVVNEAPTTEIEQELIGLSRYSPNRRLLEAILYCRTKIEGIGGESGGAESLYGLVGYLEGSVKVVRLIVPSEANAYTVFETLNDRGLDLSVLDLIKNYLFGRAPDETRLREVQSRWTQMSANLSDVAGDDFLKAWWTSRYGRVQSAQLFPKFRQAIVHWSKVSETSEDLLRASDHYSALEAPDDAIWADLSPKGRQSVRALRTLGAKQVHPVMLSAIMKYSQKEKERLLRLLEVLIVRYQLIGGGRTGRLEIGCASLAHAIWEGEVASATEASKELGAVIPSDEDFRDAFKGKVERNSRKVTYILACLERQARKAGGMDPSELDPAETLTVEHILPKNPGSGWNPILEADPAFHEECTYRMGNVCLLSGVNRALGNKAFEEKKKTYAQSDLVLTSELGAESAWTREAVEERQARLAKLAVASWRFQ